MGAGRPVSSDPFMSKVRVSQLRRQRCLVGKPARPVAVIDSSVDILNLGTRARRVVDALEVKTIGDLVQYSSYELSSRRRCGLVTMYEIVNKLKLFGLSLAADSDPT